MEAHPVCPKCSLSVLPAFYFCPNCGKQLRSKAIVVSWVTIVGVCLLSFFLPPFGLYPAFKYIRQTNKRTKLVGWLAVALTIIAYIIGIYSFITLMQQLNSTYGTLLQY